MNRINSLVQKLASIAPKAAPLANSSVRSTYKITCRLLPCFAALAIGTSVLAAANVGSGSAALVPPSTRAVGKQSVPPRHPRHRLAGSAISRVLGGSSRLVVSLTHCDFQPTTAAGRGNLYIPGRVLQRRDSQSLRPFVPGRATRSIGFFSTGSYRGR